MALVEIGDGAFHPLFARQLTSLKVVEGNSKTVIREIPFLRLSDVERGPYA